VSTSPRAHSTAWAPSAWSTAFAGRAGCLRPARPVPGCRGPHSRPLLVLEIRARHEWSLARGASVVGDSINLAARLNTVAGCDEIVVSNTLYRRLPDTFRAEFQELPPVEAKNVGRIRVWKLGPLRPPVA